MPKKRKVSDQHSVWLVKQNHPTPDQLAAWKTAMETSDFITGWVYQLQESTDGTPYMQGAFCCKGDIAPSERLDLGFAQYVLCKDKTTKNASNHDTWTRIAEQCQTTMGRLSKPVLGGSVPVKSDDDCDEYYGWQLMAEKILKDQWASQDARTINWFWSARSGRGTGKTDFIRRWLFFNHGSLLVDLDGTKRAVARAQDRAAKQPINFAEPRYIFLNLRQSNINKAYSELPEIKLGAFTAGSRMCALRKHPVVTVLARRPPGWEHSTDANNWNVVNLDKWMQAHKANCADQLTQQTSKPAV